jgi:hypothetical protein
VLVSPPMRIGRVRPFTSVRNVYDVHIGLLVWLILTGVLSSMDTSSGCLPRECSSNCGRIARFGRLERRVSRLYRINWKRDERLRASPPRGSICYFWAYDN